MPKRSTKDIAYQTNTTTTNENGKKESTSTQKIKVAQEPDFVKLYLNTLLTFKDLPKQMSPLLLELLKLMSYADPEADYGGQLIVLSTIVKNSIIKRLDIKINTLNHGLVKLTKSGILKRLGQNTYQANPHMFGRGEWIDIKSIQAKFNFNAGTVDADIIQSDSSYVDDLLERAAAGNVKEGG